MREAQTPAPLSSSRPAGGHRRPFTHGTRGASALVDEGRSRSSHCQRRTPGLPGADTTILCLLPPVPGNHEDTSVLPPDSATDGRRFPWWPQRSPHPHHTCRLSDHTRHRGASEPRNPPLGTLLACPVPAPSPAHIQAHCALGTPSEPHSAQAQRGHRAPGAPHTWEVGSRQVPAALGGAHEEGPPLGQGPAVPQPGGHQGVPGLLAQVGDGLGYLSMWGKLGVLGLDLAGSKTSVPPRH